MTREGPPLATLLRRIVDTPPDFLAEPKVGDQGVVHVDARTRCPAHSRRKGEVEGDYARGWGLLRGICKGNKTGAQTTSV